MKKIIQVSIVLLLGFQVNAQKKTVTEYRDFTLITIKNDSGVESANDVKFIATLSTSPDSIIVKDNANKSIINLNYPLNFESFQQQINRYIDDYTVKYSSSLEVFYWIVSITINPQTQPLAGELLVNNYVQISNESDQKNLRNNAMNNKQQFDLLDSIKHLDEYLNLIKNTNVYFDKPSIFSMPHQQRRKSLILDSLLNYGCLITRNLPEVMQDTTKPFFISSPKYIGKISDYYRSFTDSIYSRDFKKSIYLIDSTYYDTVIHSLINKLKINQAKKTKFLNELSSNNIFQIEKVEIQFEKGFIERIQVTINRNDKKLIFENLYPIGFSSIPNYKQFKNIRLFPRTQDRRDWNNRDLEYIYLSDIIQNYDNKLDLATKDYSPGDTVVIIKPNENPFAKLLKQKSIYLLDGKTFTDVNGFNEKSPNGLVQIELSRRFNINTNRHQVKNSINYGIFGYLNAQVNFSKIENKLKGLPLHNERVIENKTVVSPSYASNLDFQRYENISIRLDLNIFTYDVPHYKIAYYFDFGFKYGHTPVTDSTFTLDNSGTITTATAVDLDAHSFTFYPKIIVELFSERRYGLNLSYQLNNTHIFTNNQFKPVLSYSGKGNDLLSLKTNPAVRWSHTAVIYAFFDPTPEKGTGKIFAKACFNFQNKDINTFYPQILLGYAFNIFK